LPDPRRAHDDGGSVSALPAACDAAGFSRCWRSRRCGANIRARARIPLALTC